MLSTLVFIAFNSQSLAFTSISFRDLPRLYDIIRGSSCRSVICLRRGLSSISSVSIMKDLEEVIIDITDTGEELWRVYGGLQRKMNH